MPAPTPARSPDLTRYSVEHPRTIALMMFGVTLLLGLLAALPTVWPPAAAVLSPATVDTDPENMLAHDEPVRLFHDQMKASFDLHDMVVVGVVDEAGPDGVFTVDTLKRVYQLTQHAKTLHWPDPHDPNRQIGVIGVDVIAPSTVDHIDSAGPGIVEFSWLMPQPPATPEAARAVRDKARDIPFLDGTLLSDDGKALALYLPLTDKDASYEIRAELLKKIASFGDTPETYHITGLPVAEDTFGVEMFIQMAISAPLAMLVIFLLMWWFFRKLTLIIPPMIVAVVCAISTMAALVISGSTIHIMSSMIPIFIMPIAVLDAIHIISDFFDRYRHLGDRKRTILAVMDSLFSPMLFTSLTTAAGFASLALTPIPPVQVFGMFVALGVMLAWFWTITFIPAAIMFIPEKRLASLATAVGDDAGRNQDAVARSPITRLLGVTGRFTTARSGVVIAVTVIVAIVAGYGISRITINDNPTKWFTASHPIRVADRVLNEHFAGTYMAYLVLQPEQGESTSPADALTALTARLDARVMELKGEGVEHAAEVFAQMKAEAERLAADAADRHALLAQLKAYAEVKLDEADDAHYDAWDAAALFISIQQQRDELFKQPDVLRYIEGLQRHLLAITSHDGQPLVGKSNALTDIVKTVHRELLDDEAAFRIPNSPAAVAQCIAQYESSHRPQDLSHFVTRDAADPDVHYRRTNLWLQLKSGDNRDMVRVAEAVDQFFRDNPPPVALQHDWFGLTYINVVWQDKMVSGMLQAFLGSFLVVLLMMILLFRSALWGILSMIPLTVTVGLIYGLIGLMGKDYDMPVAVLSSLSLGLAVDYAIHFLARSREAVERHGSWANAAPYMFGEPARAITRNAIVVGVGFLPLLAAPLMPYKTVGVFIALILLTAGVATLLILPALITLAGPLLFPQTKAAGVACRCGTCIVSVIAAVALVAVNVHQFVHIGYATLTSVSLIAIPVLAMACVIASRRKACAVTEAAPAGQ